MQPLLDRKLLFLTGKGGVGKTTIAAALGALAAERGRSVIVVEVGEQSRLPALFGVPAPSAGAQTQLAPGLAGISIDPDRALLEWLQSLGGRVSGRMLASSGTFQYFAAAAPGAKELFTMVKIWQLARAAGRRHGHDLVIVDAPATGHALAMLRAPHTFGAIARIGPVAGHTREIQELLEDEERSAYVAVALGSEMAVTEALEIEEGLGRELGRSLSAVIVNGLLPRRFSAAEMRSIQAIPHDPAPPIASSPPADVRAAAVRAAIMVHERARFQHNQLARLRRRSFEVIGVPFVWDRRIEEPAVRRIAERIGQTL